jgi:hypothetical protein
LIVDRLLSRAEVIFDIKTRVATEDELGLSSVSLQCFVCGFVCMMSVMDEKRIE